MELITAHRLWRDYDYSALPLNETLIREEKADNYKIEYIYFNGEPTQDGCVRIFARVYTPTDRKPLAGMVLCNDANDPFDMTYTSILLQNGYTVIVPDYAGKRDSGLYTIYPYSLRSANFFSEESDFNSLPNNPKLHSHFSYACVMLRAYCYLKQKGSFRSGKIGFFGVREGALSVYKAAFVEPEAFCAIALFNSCYIPSLDIKSEEANLYNSCLANQTYAALLTVPTYIIESSNNSENSLFSSSALYTVSSNSVSMYIAEHSDNTLSSSQTKSLVAFVNNHRNGKVDMASYPIIEAKNSDRQLYFNITIPSPKKVVGVYAYHTFGNGRGAYRNWLKLPLVKISETEYLCKVDVFLPKDEMSAFVTVKYENDFCLSSEILTRIPLLLGVASKNIIKSRLVYDADMGTEAWLVTKSKLSSSRVFIKKGSKGIEGVTGSTNSVTSLSIGDIRTQGEQDSTLQLLIYSEKQQTLDIQITCLIEDEYLSYSTTKWVSSFGEWSKITLSSNEFKSDHGTMDGWQDAVCITINSESELLINSVVWI